MREVVIVALAGALIGIMVVALLRSFSAVRRASPHPGLLRHAGLLEHSDQQRIRSFGERGNLCAPTAHQTNGINGVSPESE